MFLDRNDLEYEMLTHFKKILCTLDKHSQKYGFFYGLNELKAYF